MWIISNIAKPASCQLPTKVIADGYNIYSSLSFHQLVNGGSAFMVSGNAFYSSSNALETNTENRFPSSGINDGALFDSQFHKKVEQLDGNFIILEYDKQGFRIFGDKFGIKKYFFYQKGEVFVIASHIALIKEFIPLEISIENNIVYALTYHYTGGLTTFKNIKHNQPGEFLEYKHDKLSLNFYWKPTQLLENKNNRAGIEDLSLILGSSIRKRIKNDEKISLSLTGGGDTRNILALFLKEGLSPHLYTYGNPESADCVRAREIAKGLNLEHHIHDVSMTAKVFEKYARRIIREAGGLASIHRVHRLIAIEKEREYAETMFLGTLGGEFIKGAEHDNYIIPAIVYENWGKETYDADWLSGYFENKRINSDVDINNVLAYIESEPFFNGSEINRKLYALTHITAHLHDAQDVMLYENIMDSVHTPFLDSDYLEMLFGSNYSFAEKEKKSSNYYLKKIDYPVFAAKFLQATYPPLLSYKYSGYHKPSEVLFNKYYAALIKLARQKRSIAHPANFPLTLWMQEFVENNLKKCMDYHFIRQIYDLDLLLKEFSQGNHLQNERYWLKFTNPIMLRFVIEEMM